MATIEQRLKALEQAVKTGVAYSHVGGGAGGRIINAAQLVVGQSSAVVIQQISVYSLTATPALQGPNTTSEQLFTVNGLALNDKIYVNGPAPTAAIIVAARVSATNQIALTFVNPTGLNQTAASGTYKIVAIRS